MPLKHKWIFGPGTDFVMFGAPLVLSLGTAWFDAVRTSSAVSLPVWFWLLTAVGLDSAHVYGMLFRVYLNPPELRRRPLLYFGAPVIVGALAFGLMALSATVFWRSLTYVAIYHFVKQQLGWLSIYHRREGGVHPIQKKAEQATLLFSMLWPIVYWHLHSTRNFVWFMEGELVPLPSQVGVVVQATAGLLGTGYVTAALLRYLRKNGTPGKDLLMLATAVCWHLGLVDCDSDAVFTATNVFLHSVPYLVLIYRHGLSIKPSVATPYIQKILCFGPLAMLAILWLAATIEDTLWDKLVWHAQPLLFGDPWVVSDAYVNLAVVLLTIPQGVHFLLDAYIWRGNSNPSLKGLFA